MKAQKNLGSIEKAPLIRKFTVLFIVMSLLPFLVIAYLFTQYGATGSININQNTLFVLLMFVGLGTLAGFYGMRKSIVKIQNLTRAATQALSKGMPSGLESFKGEESEINQLTHAFNEVTKSLEDNIKRLQASKKTMQDVLTKLAIGLSSAKTIDTFVDLIVEITANALDARSGVLMLLDEDKQELYIKAASGFKEEFRSMRLKVGEEGPGWVAKHRKPLLVPELRKQPGEDTNDPFAPPLLCAPMMYQERMIGVLSVSGKLIGGSFQEDELIIISNLATQTAVAVENERLHTDAEKTYLETISALAMAVEARDLYSRGHSDRVSQYSVKVAEKLGLTPEEVKDIKSAAELHDVGKIGIADEILRKTSALTDEEQAIMRKHSVIGEGIVKPVRTLSRLCGIIRHHHEALDGSGYPDRLKGDDIPLGAKILAITDTFDAMTTDRPYRKGLSFDAAKAEIKKYADIHYDRKIVDVFLSVI